MSVIKSTPPAERPAEPVVYRPLSGLALASIFLAAGYALVLTVVCAVAFVAHEPVPLVVWTLIFPMAAAGLAIVARRQIRNAEGTRTGLALANAAWWISIVFGLGYVAFYVATYMAVSWQARDFTNRWFDMLRKGDVTAAFLQTQPPEAREGDDPSNAKRLRVRYGMPSMGKRGPLPIFQENEFVRVIQHAGADLKIDELGVNSWEHEQGSYRIKQSYRLTSPEGEFEAQVTVRSSESRSGRRNWQIWWNDAETGFVGQPQLSDFGKALQYYRHDAVRFASEWVYKRHSGNFEGAYLDTREPSERSGLLREYWARQAVAVFALAGSASASAGPDSVLTHLASVYDPELRWASCLPGFPAFAAGEIIRTDRFDPSRKWKDEAPKDLRGIFRHGSVVRYKLTETHGRPLPVDKNANRYRIAVNIDFDGFSPDSPGAGPRYQGTAEAIVESDAGPIATTRTPQWRVVILDLLTADDPPEDPRKAMMEGGMPPGGMPRGRPPR